MIIEIFILALLGSSLGSFLNVCAYRIPRGLSVVTMRSFCPACHRHLRWSELIPIISFVRARGRCQSCSTSISTQYPVIELLVGTIILLLFLRFDSSADFVYVAAFLILMLLLAIIDWQHLIIPNKVVLVGLALGLILIVDLYFESSPTSILNAQRSVLTAHRSPLYALCSMLLAPTSLVLLRTAGNWLFKKDTLGFGDIKLGALIGLFLGFQDFLLALWLAAIMGIIYRIVLGIVRSRETAARFVAASTRLPGNLINCHPERSEGSHSLSTIEMFRSTQHDKSKGRSELRLPFGSFLALSSSMVLLSQETIHMILESWLII